MHGPKNPANKHLSYVYTTIHAVSSKVDIARRKYEQDEDEDFASYQNTYNYVAPNWLNEAFSLF